MSAATNPLAILVLDAQEIIADAISGRQNDAIAITRLAQLLCGPAVHVELMKAGAMVEVRRRNASAAAT